MVLFLLANPPWVVGNMEGLWGPLAWWVRERERERERELSSLLRLKILYGHITFSALFKRCLSLSIKKFFSHHRCTQNEKKIFFHCTPKQMRPYLVEKKKFNYIFSAQHLAYVSKWLSSFEMFNFSPYTLSISKFFIQYTNFNKLYSIQSSFWYTLKSIII